MDYLEDDFLQWITEKEKLDEEVFEELKQSYITLGWLRKERTTIIKRMAEGGRNRRQPQRTNGEHYERIKDDFFGFKEKWVNGVFIEKVPALAILGALYQTISDGTHTFLTLAFRDSAQDYRSPRVSSHT